MILTLTNSHAKLFSKISASKVQQHTEGMQNNLVDSIQQCKYGSGF